MVGTTVPAGTEPTRRHLTAKQADTVERMTTCAVEILLARGYASTTIRRIAAAAGVGTATAYVYFSSKEHVFSEIFWRRLTAAPRPEFGELGPADRVVLTLREMSLLVADEPALALAVSSALLGDDPDVQYLRVQIAAEIRRRLTDALGGQDHGRIAVLELLYTGAMLQAGIGRLSYAQVGDLLAACAYRILNDGEGPAGRPPEQSV
ncbi:TetR/AcrR family transcriptional regulator [Nocardia tengchongensis]|uniref:TetR/AcrR family transcriptional regulator n=1 Tax=Nocardia tengchongensis TaxID=2055889 RepID=UPI00368AA067